MLKVVSLICIASWGSWKEIKAHLEMAGYAI